MYNSVYYRPEDYGLEKILEVELDDESYQFNIICVWFHKKTNKYYTAHDSGCSCPTPFENMGIDDLEQIKDFDNVINAIKNAKGIDVLEKQRLITILNNLNKTLKVNYMKTTIELSIDEVKQLIIDNVVRNNDSKDVDVVIKKDKVVLTIEPKQ